eukprot:Pgem_evm1s9491
MKNLILTKLQNTSNCNFKVQHVQIPFKMLHILFKSHQIPVKVQQIPFKVLHILFKVHQTPSKNVFAKIYQS